MHFKDKIRDFNENLGLLMVFWSTAQQCINSFSAGVFFPLEMYGGHHTDLS